VESFEVESKEGAAAKACSAWLHPLSLCSRKLSAWCGVFIACMDEACHT